MKSVAQPDKAPKIKRTRVVSVAFIERRLEPIAKAQNKDFNEDECRIAKGLFHAIHVLEPQELLRIPNDLHLLLCNSEYLYQQISSKREQGELAQYRSLNSQHDLWFDR